MEQQAQQRTDLKAQLIERASRDQAFRQELLANPKVVIEREFNLQLPASMEIRVVEDTPSTAYLLLPAAPVGRSQQLSDQELEAVAGGWTTATEGSGCTGVGPPCGFC